MFIRHKKKIIMFGLVALALTVSAIIARKLSEGFETFAAGTYQAYDFQDWIYYDPVTGSSDCGVNNYWTFYNTDTTCYRFFMAERNDNSSNSTVKLILDHNAGYGPFSNVNTVLSETSTAWQDYGGQLSLITENELMTLLTIQEQPSIYKDSSGIHTVDKDGKYYRYASNTEFLNNGSLQNGHGYWTGTTMEFDGSTYAYTLTEAGWNRLVNVSENRGIRPVITLDKTKIAGSSHGVTDITSLTQNATRYQYSKYTYGSTTFAQLQGFTVTDGNFKNSSSDNLIFYSSNSGDSNNGLIFGYTGSNFNTNLNGPCGGNPCYIQGTGHGNDMTYNTNNHQVYVLGGNYIWQYNGTNAPIQYVQNPTSSIGYRDPKQDDFSDIGAQDMYFVNAGFRVYLTDGSFNNKYMFDASTDEIGQGFEYHNGYLYYATSTTNIPCASDYHHCGSFNSMSGVIDVYNVKLNSDGTPSKNFGRREKRFYTNGDNLKMELESISFRDNQAYLGYSAQHYVSADTPFRFYTFTDSNIAVNLDTNTSYQDTSDSTTVIISSGDQLKPVSGYTMSADGYSMSKTVNAATISDNLNVCDYYNNCTTVSFSHTNPNYDPTKPAQIVTFVSSSVNKTYGDANFTNAATTSGDGNITYTSSNTAIATVNATSGEVTIHSAGSATITATAAATTTYREGAASYPLTIAKATSTRPSELDIVFAGVAGEPLSTISFATPGLSWVDSATLISVGTNTYPVYYTQNNDSTNYTTETFTATVDTSKLAQTVTFASSSVDKIYGDANFTNAATTSGDGNITYTSDNTTVASVDATSGEVTIHSAGSATITATASATSTYAEGIASYPLTVAKATSTRPSELDIVFAGVAGEPLSTISFTTPGLSWVDSATIISAGTNNYQVYYTQNNDSTNYTTETFTATVNTPKPAQTVTFTNSSVSKTYGDANFTNTATTSGDGAITYTSDNTSVATVNATSGEVTIHSAGSATITATAAATSTYAEGTASYPLTVAKATSTRPSELDIVFTGIVGEPLSTISFATLGIVWENGSTVIAIGNNEYPVYYTQNNDTTNYTTESFMATVNGLQRRYEVVDGDGQTYTIGESEVASFKINAEFSLFEAGGEVYIDGSIIDQGNYVAESGSTIISLKKAYVDTLSIGTHTIIVLFADQGVASAEFSVVANPGPEPEPTPDPEHSGDDDDVVVPDTSSTPDTGENTKNENSIVNIILILPVALPVIALFIYISRAKSIKHRKFDYNK